MNLKIQRGMVLVIMLIFLQGFVLLGWVALEYAKRLQAMVADLWQQQQMDYAGEAVLSSLEKGLDDMPKRCWVTARDWQYDHMRQQWQKLAPCSGEWSGELYQYVVEYLDTDPCALVDGSAAAVRHDRVTLLLTSKDGRLQEGLQSSYRRLDNVERICEGDQHRLDLGRQMWREW